MFDFQVGASVELQVCMLSLPILEQKVVACIDFFFKVTIEESIHDIELMKWPMISSCN